MRIPTDPVDEVDVRELVVGAVIDVVGEVVGEVLDGLPPCRRLITRYAPTNRTAITTVNCTVRRETSNLTSLLCVRFNYFLSNVSGVKGGRFWAPPVNEEII